VEHSHFFKQDHSYTTTLSLADFGAQFYKQRFDIASLDVSTCRAGEDQFKSSLVLPPHGICTTIRYRTGRAHLQTANV
jgi:hypothetical protein